MNIRRLDVSLSATTGTTNTATTETVNGRVLGLSIQYASATGTGFATTAVLVITSAVTGQTVYSETLTTLATTSVTLIRRPRVVQQTTAGVSLTATESLVREPSFVANEALLVSATVVGSGSKAATVYVIVDG